MSDERPSQIWVGLPVAIAGVAVLTAFSSVAPAAIHKLILFAIAFGAGAGGIVAWTSREFGLPRAVGLPLTILLIMGGLTAIAVYRHQRLRQEARSVAAKDAEQMLALQMLKSAAEEDSEIAADYERHRRRINPTFADYLAVRVRPLGKWEHPRPSLFWAGEVCLAVSAGVFLCWRLSKRPTTFPQSSSVDSDRTSEIPEA